MKGSNVMQAYLSMLNIGRAAATVESPGFDWHHIAPSNQLVYHDCFKNFKCARLQVPLDWNASPGTDNRTADIAIIKVPATVPVADKTYGGAVVTNPGGPGLSGVDQVLSGGLALRTLLSAGPNANASGAKNFDIIGFDPRGVNNTTPALHCFPDSRTAAQWAALRESHGHIGSSEQAFNDLWALNRAFAEGCTAASLQHNDIVEYMSTASVARDIIEIFERHGQWRQAETKRLAASNPSECDKSVISRNSWKKGKELIQYWGFSYGTVLGATLSAMYPERVHRVLLDGVVDSHEYMAANWLPNLADTDKEIDWFAKYCYEGGAENCAMYDIDGISTIKANFLRVLQDIKQNPIGIPGNGKAPATLFTSSDLETYIFASVYSPVTSFPPLAQLLKAIKDRDSTTVAQFKPPQSALDASVPEACAGDAAYTDDCYPEAEPMFVTLSGVFCSDGISITNTTKSEYQAYAQKMLESSKLIGGIFADDTVLPCTGWNARPKWRYDGNFHNKTARPILLAGNTIDPVTPFHDTIIMGRGFDGAGILHQHSAGHCTYSAPSMCSAKAVRHYFQTGELPGASGAGSGQINDPLLEGWDGPAAYCEADIVPFSGYDADASPPLPRGETDEELWEALLDLNKVF